MNAEPQAAPTPLTVRPLTADAVARYGRMWGQPWEPGAGGPAFSNPATDFWHAHLFDPGAAGATEVLWVHYRGTETTVPTLEKHLLTEQAIVPLTGGIVQILVDSDAAGQPDPATAAAFWIPPGQGLCMRPGCWHATRLTGEQVTCLMLTRSSTTQDLVGHLHGQHPARESAIERIAPLQLQWPSGG